MQTKDLLFELSASSPVSGEELAEGFGVSRNAIWKHIEKLRDEGFEIESNGDGYRLVDVPEYGGLAIEYHLGESMWEIEYYDEADSTNAVAEEEARDDAPEGTVVVAEKQTAGRGRREREWSSPPGGVWMSLVLRPTMPPRDASVITLIAAVAVARALETVGAEPSIKWPNDVMIGDRKVCGILTEMQADAERIDYAVVGIGLNANIEPPIEKSTSLRNEIGDVNRASLVASILAEFDELYDAPHDEILEEWRSRSSTVGREVRVEMPNETVEGEAVGVDSTGALRVKTAEGERVVTVGDCEHLR
ncbi:MAG: biotin--[acetyl-CoA-carboxylase] ligase [Halobacteria archaeon]|nr:biotin--[acetyl-CoA-carboxylase] ligase [Halobacteria archaeon]